MLDDIKALITLSEVGTISETAVRLRLTQSAVSKRIQSLEQKLGFKLVEPNGRKLRLTSRALSVIYKSKPLLHEFESLRFLDSSKEDARYSIGIADSIASSWGPAAIRKALSIAKDIELDLHVHRSTLILEQIRLGRYELGLVTGNLKGSALSARPVANEVMVLVGKSNEKSDTIVTIEEASSTWKQIGSEISKYGKFLGSKFIFVESFPAAVQMAKAGFGKALAPKEIAEAMGIKQNEITSLSPRITRQIQLITRKSIAETRSYQLFSDALISCVDKYLY